jgi:hypothetical protein
MYGIPPLPLSEKIQMYALFFVRYVYSNLSKFSSVPG